MKKVILSIAVVLCSLLASAQYYYIPNINAGENPRSLNNDIEQASATGWTTIHTGPASSPAWSSVATIPFTFKLNDTAVTSYKVATSGVLTFNTSFSTAPTDANVSLPSALIPDKSILVWGLLSQGSNDIIRHKTFGTAPNRQHWIQFTSYTSPGYTSSGTVFTYWAIVLEETTNKIYVVDQRTANMPNLSLTIGVYVNSSNYIQVAGSPSVNSNASTLAMDDVSDNSYYEFIYGTQSQEDVMGVKITNETYLSNAAPISITGVIRNLGADTVNSIDINYSINNGPVKTVNKSGLSILCGSSYTFSHDSTWTATPGVYTIDAWASNINGLPDTINGNDSISKQVAVHNSTEQRLVLIEEFTQASCGPCAAQNPAFNALLNSNSTKLTSIKYHTSWPGVDPMYTFNTSDPTTRVNYYGVTGVPWGEMDGETITGGSYFGAPNGLTQAEIDAAYAKVALYSITASASYWSNSMVITGSVTAQSDIITGPVKIQVALVENPVSYSSAPGSNGETSFPHVLRKLFPTAGTNIGQPTDGQTNTFNYNYTIPSTLVTANLELVVFVQDDATKQVFQAFHSPVTVGITDENSTIESMNIFPNPFSDRTNVVLNLKQNEDVTITIFNSMGQSVYASEKMFLRQGNNQIEINSADLANGIYFVTINAGEYTTTRTVSISK